MARLTPRQIALIIGAVVALILLYGISSSISRAGKVAVEIKISPRDSIVRIDGKQSKAGKVYVEPGMHTFSGARENFKDDYQKIEVHKDNDLTVYLLPEADTEQAYNYLKDNPAVQRERERFGGLQANAKGIALREEIPLINSLPITWNHGLSSIGSGPSAEIEGGTAIIVQADATADRKAAVDWIKQQAANPSDLDIEFPDFVNPLIKDIKSEGTQ